MGSVRPRLTASARQRPAPAHPDDCRHPANPSNKKPPGTTGFVPKPCSTARDFPEQSADIPAPRRWNRWDKAARQRLERVTSPRLPFGGIGAHCTLFFLRDLAVGLRSDDKVPVIGRDTIRQDADG